MSAEKSVTVEEAQSQIDQLRVMVFAYSYPTHEVIKRVTRAIGTSIDGFEFDMEEATYGTPARINVIGKTDDGKKWSVDLAIARIDELDNDEWDSDDFDDEAGDES